MIIICDAIELISGGNKKRKKKNFYCRNYNENLNNTLERDEYNEIDDQFSENDIQDYEKQIHFADSKSRKLLASNFDEVRTSLPLINVN